MTVTTEDLREVVNCSPRLETVLERCLAEGTELVEQWIAGEEVPQTIRDRAVLEVAADLFNRRSAPHGIVNQQFDGPDGGGAPIRINRDPMTPAYKLLRPWVRPL